MRVLLVTPYFPPTWAYGGIPRIVDGLARALAARGLSVTVLTTDAGDAARRNPVPPDRDHHGARVLSVRNLSNRLAWEHQLFLPLGARRALALLDAAPPDVVHVHGHRHLLEVEALRYARARGIPVALTANGTLPRLERKIGAKRAWDLVFSVASPRRYDRCVAVSAAELAHYRDAGVPPERVVRIPNGLDLGEFEELPPRGSFRAPRGLGNRPLVAYLGQISPRKGVEHLCAAFEGGALGEAMLVVAGPERGLRLKRPDHVLFTGVLEGRDRLALLADADVLVYPTTAEVFGLVPFEGLLCGAPVVVGEDCGCGELIAEAGAGLLVRYADIEGIRARIRTLLQDRVAAEAMVHRGRRYIAERLRFERVAALHEALYTGLIAGRGPG